MPREKSRYRERDRRSSSRSSESSYERKKSKSKHKRRSRSRDKSESSSSHRRKRSTSRSRQRSRRSHSTSPSRDRYEKSRRRSSSRSRSKKDRSHSRSSSRSRSKYNKSKKSHKRRSSSSRSSSFEIERPLLSKIVNLDDTVSKVEKAIKAAEAAGLTMTKIPTYEYKEVEIKEDMPTIHDRNLLAELNSESFVPKTFTSSRSNKKESKNIVIDLDAETVSVPESDIKQKDDCIFDLDELPSEEELKEMWIQKLCTYRKRMLQDET